MFDGVDLAKADEATKRALWGAHLTSVAQAAAASFNPAHRLIDQTAACAVRDGNMGHAEAVEDAIELFRVLPLPNPETIGGRYPHHASGGQLQPMTSALDQIVQECIPKPLMRLKKEKNISYLSVTHDIATVSAIPDEIVVMTKGAVVEHGPKNLDPSPPCPDYTKLLLSSVPEMDPDWLTRIENTQATDKASTNA